MPGNNIPSTCHLSAFCWRVAAPQIGVTKAVCLGHGYNLRSERNKRLIYQFERTEDSIRSDRMAVAPQSGTHAQCFRVIASLTG